MTRQRFIFLTLAPATLVLVTLALVSTGGALWFSVMNRALRSPDSEFVGAYNYLRLLRDKRFFNALEISAIWEVVTVAGTLIVAVLLAVLVHETVKRALWRNLICFAFLAPVLLPRVAAAFIWPWLNGPLPPSKRRQTVCVVQITTLIVCLGPIVPPLLANALTAVSLALLTLSFAIDVRTLARQRPTPLET